MRSLGAVESKSRAFALRIIKMYKYLTEEKKEYKKDIDLLRLDTLELLSSCDKNQIHKLIYYQPKVKYSHKLHRRNRIVPKLNLVRYIINI